MVELLVMQSFINVTDEEKYYLRKYKKLMYRINQ